MLSRTSAKIQLTLFPWRHLVVVEWHLERKLKGSERLYAPYRLWKVCPKAVASGSRGVFLPRKQ